jgi:hypothetical protein
MKLTHLILTATFVGTAFAKAEVSESIRREILGDMTWALGMNIPVSDEDNKKREVASNEASASINLNPGALAEFEALTQFESGGSSVSAVILQEAVSDYEALNAGTPVPPLISYYIARSQVGVLSPRQRFLAFVMIKSALRRIHAKTK